MPTDTPEPQIRGAHGVAHLVAGVLGPYRRLMYSSKWERMSPDRIAHGRLDLTRHVAPTVSYEGLGDGNQLSVRRLSDTQQHTVSLDKLTETVDGLPEGRGLA